MKKKRKFNIIYSVFGQICLIIFVVLVFLQKFIKNVPSFLFLSRLLLSNQVLSCQQLFPGSFYKIVFEGAG